MAERARVAGERGRTARRPIDASIWSQWQYLTEYPGVVRAEFRRDYLALPEEVLVTVMRVHQKQLPIRDAQRPADQLLPGRARQRRRSGRQRRVRQLVRHQRPLRRRAVLLRDRSQADARRAPRAALAPAVPGEARQLPRQDASASNASPPRICRPPASTDDATPSLAARLCKTDLVTEMVKEFTDLQGQDRRHLRARRRAAGERLAGHLRSLPAGQPRRRAAAQRRRRGRLAGRPHRHAGRLLLHRREADRLEGSVRAAPRRAGRRADPAQPRQARGEDRRRHADRPRHRGTRRRPAAPQLDDDLLAFFAERVRTHPGASAWQFAYDEIAAAMEAGWAPSLTDLVDRIAGREGDARRAELPLDPRLREAHRQHHRRP